MEKKSLINSINKQNATTQSTKETNREAHAESKIKTNALLQIFNNSDRSISDKNYKHLFG